MKKKVIIHDTPSYYLKLHCKVIIHDTPSKNHFITQAHNLNTQILHSPAKKWKHNITVYFNLHLINWEQVLQNSHILKLQIQRKL